MKIAILILLLSSAANAGTVETWTVGGKTFTDKGMVKHYIYSHPSNVPLMISHTECQLMKNDGGFKKCPKNGGSFGSMPFTKLVKEGDAE